MFDRTVAKQLIVLCNALGLQATVEKTDFSQLQSNIFPNTDARYLENKNEIEQEFKTQGFDYTVCIDLNPTGYMTVLNEFAALAQMTGHYIETRTAFIVKIFQFLLQENNLAPYMRFLKNTSIQGRSAEQGVPVQISTQQDITHSKFLIAMDADTIQQIATALASILDTKTQLEMVMHAFEFKTNASAFVEHIFVRKQNYSDPEHQLDDYFCIAFDAYFSQPKPFADLKKLFHAMGIDTYEIIRDRMDSRDLCVRFSRAEYQKILKFSPDFLASMIDLVSEYAKARQQKRILAADAIYDAICHLVKTHTHACHTQSTQVPVTPFSGDDWYRHMSIHTAQENKTVMPRFTTMPATIVTQLPTTKRYAHLRDWQTGLDGLVYADRLAEEATPKKFLSFFSSQKSDTRQFLDQQSTTSFDEKIRYFEVAALHPTGFVGQALQQNRTALYVFLTIDFPASTYRRTAENLSYLQKWQEHLEQMYQVESMLANHLTTLRLGMPSDHPSNAIYAQFIDTLQGTTEITGSLPILEETIKTLQFMQTHYKKEDLDTYRIAETCRQRASDLTKIMDRAILHMSWENLTAQYDHEPLPLQKAIDLKPIQQAFKEVGLGDVHIETMKDGIGNINYAMRFKKALTEADEIAFLESFGMHSVSFDEPQIFRSHTAPEKKRIEWKSESNQIICNSQHVQGFIEKYNAYHQNAVKVAFVFEKLLHTPVQILNPMDAFKKYQINELMVALTDPNALIDILELMRALGLQIHSIDNQLIFSEHTWAQFNERALVFQFFKSFLAVRKQCLKEKNKAGSEAMTALLCHLVGKIFGSDVANLWSELQLNEHTRIKSFNPDQSRMGALRMEVETWAAQHQEMIQSGGDTLSRFINDIVTSQDALFSTIPFTLLYQRHGLLSVQCEQEKSIEKLLHVFLSKNISMEVFRDNLNTLLTAQVFLKSAIQYQVEQKIMLLSPDRILIEDLERIDNRAETIIFALNLVQRLLDDIKADREVSAKSYLQDLDDIMHRSHEACSSSHVLVFSKIKMLISEHATTTTHTHLDAAAATPVTRPSAPSSTANTVPPVVSTRAKKETTSMLCSSLPS